jgi:hypothetical protein
MQDGRMRRRRQKDSLVPMLCGIASSPHVPFYQKAKRTVSRQIRIMAIVQTVVLVTLFEL